VNEAAEPVAAARITSGSMVADPARNFGQPRPRSCDHGESEPPGALHPQRFIAAISLNLRATILD